MRGATLSDGIPASEENVGSWKGFYVAQHSKLVLTRCSVTNFDVGLRVRDTGRVIISGSQVTTCNIGILVKDC